MTVCFLFSNCLQPQFHSLYALDKVQYLNISKSKSSLSGFLLPKTFNLSLRALFSYHRDATSRKQSKDGEEGRKWETEKGGKAILICHVLQAREIVWLSLSLSLAAISPICVPARSSIVDWAIDWRELHRSMLLTAWITVICHYRRMSLQTFSLSPSVFLSVWFSLFWNYPSPLFFLFLWAPSHLIFFLSCANNWWLWGMDGRVAVIRRSMCQNGCSPMWKVARETERTPGMRGRKSQYLLLTCWWCRHMKSLQRERKWCNLIVPLTSLYL